MVADGDAKQQEETFFREVMDPFVRALLDAGDPWDAYEAVVSMRGRMLDYLEWGPHGGAVFTAWANLEDIYDTGKTPIPEAHSALRDAAERWLARPSGPHMAAYIEEWIARADRAVAAFTDRDGDFWRGPKE